MSPVIVVALFFAMGLFFVGLCLARLSRRRPLAAARSALAACPCLALAVLSTAAGMNLWTYHRLSFERPVASLEFEQIGPRRFTARVLEQGRPETRFELSGDQWQLEARVLKWRAPANLLGFNAQYRLERLTGRYASIVDERRGLRSAHQLAGEPGLDFWRLTQRYPHWLPIVDTQYGNATYMPMADKARYDVNVTQSGLVSRPANDAARMAMRRW